MRSSSLSQQVAFVKVIPEEKARLNCELYHRRSNVIIRKDALYWERLKMYQIQLINLADPTKCLHDHFLMFYSSIFQTLCPSDYQSHQINGPTFHKIYLFLVDCYLLQAKLNRGLVNGRNQTIADLLETLLDRYMFKQQPLILHQVQHRLKIYVRQAQQKIDRLRQLQNTQNFRIDHFVNSEVSSNQRSLWKVEQVYDVYVKLKQQLVGQVLSIDGQRKKIYIAKEYIGVEQLQRLYVDKMATTLFQIPLVSRGRKISKLQQFVNKIYKKYYRSAFVKEENGSLERNKFVINRYTSSHRGQILMDLEDLVKLRKDAKTHRSSYFEIARAIIIELVNHKKITSKSYPLLTPRSVLFNQLSLKTQLSYQNIVNSSLGLNFKPMSIEQTICFQPTPSLFDSYSAPFEFQEVNRLRMYHFYANTQNQALLQIGLQQQSQAYQTCQLLRKSELWRCLMTVSYLVKGKQYYDQSFGNPNMKQNRLNCSKSVYNRLVTDQHFYKQICDSDFIYWLTKKSQSPKYTQNKQSQFLEDLISTENDYSIIKNSLETVNISNYVKTKQEIAKLLVEALQEQQKFKTVANSIKYMIRFYVKQSWHSKYINKQTIQAVFRLSELQFSC